MYLDFYQLKKKPFNLIPDPQFLFLSEGHREALNHLLYGIEQREWFITITGDIGTGKTTICHELLEKLTDENKTIMLLNPYQCNRLFSNQTMFSPEESKSKAFIAFNGFLLDQLQQGRRVILVIDEAQHLSPSLLEQIRIFSNLGTKRGKLSQIILVGQLELMQKLKSSELRALNQRISVRYKLNPLNKKETEDYIAHRLMVAGANGNIAFSPSALKSIYKYSKGIPRVINLLCDRTLLSGFINRTGCLDKKIVKQGLKSLEGTG